jgi:hypothetical protein
MYGCLPVQSVGFSVGFSVGLSLEFDWGCVCIKIVVSSANPFIPSKSQKICKQSHINLVVISYCPSS